ncbi:MarR family winged helix-turn-helix transcriptional regulator [Chitinophaga flava]|uniref:HTH marR-type domain-containing protein n=1 Tax=Chitinophaga flava TaxID=2259036 RepID=A0A365XWD5_9BACT|nr:MarR family transcriptional regulator [Chitinophaga flava]RBL90653.1 hypothetical protein DF182_29835 [Chitinophaga flava]
MSTEAEQFEQAYTDLQCLIIAQVNKFSTEKLTATQFLILDVIIKQGDRTTSQLADYFRITAPAISRQIRKLMSDGLVIQKRDDTDRRSYFNSITPKGRKLVNEAGKLRKTMTTEISRILTAEDRKTFIRLCHHITSRISIGKS